MSNRNKVQSSWILGGAVVAFAIFAFSMRQSLIACDEAAAHRWADVEATLQRRLDLVPQLTETVRAVSKYESETLTAITESRNQLMALTEQMKQAVNDGNQDRTAELDGDLVASIRAFTGLAREAYPELTANKAYLTLMTQLEGTENRINVARQDFNDAVAKNNTSVRRWSWMPLCGSFDEREPFRCRGPVTVPMLDLGS